MDTSLFNTLGLLDCAVIKRQSADSFEVIYSSGQWFNELLPESEAGSSFQFAQSSPYLEDFLIDAEELWQQGEEGRITSGMWSEQRSEQVLRLEAIAMALDGDCYLVVNNIVEQHDQKQVTLQAARELLISSDKIAVEHEYLHQKLDEILSQTQQGSPLQQPITQALQQTELGVAIMDPELRLLTCNPALQNLFNDTGITPDRPADRLILDLFKNQYPEHQRILSTGSEWTGEVYWLNPPKQGKWLKVSIHPVKNHQRQVQYWLVTVSDVTQVKYLIKRNEKLTHFDVLTDLPNRQHFWQQLESKIKRGRPFYLLYIDIKQFKRINELHGHLVGDEVIKELSKRLNALTKTEDLIAKIGGTEFAVIMDVNHLHTQFSIQDQIQCEQFAKKLIDASTLPFYLDSGQRCEIGLNLGAAAYPKDASSAEDLMKYADLAVFSAKKKTNSALTFYSKKLVEASRKRIEMEDALRNAISEDQFELYLQPMLELETGDIVKAEALIRWHKPDGEIIPPDDFIPLAEQTGLIIPIGKWVINEACKILAKLKERGIDIKLSINLSPRQVSDRQLFDFIKTCITKERVNPKQMELELTEGVLVENYEKAHYLLEEVRKLGMSVSIDDFGTGYSSLAYIQKLPIDHLKIDRSFVKELTEESQTNDSDGAIVLAVIAMAHSLKLEVIAEGVETQMQKDFLQQHHCNTAQGYLFSKPVPYDEFCTLLESYTKVKH